MSSSSLKNIIFGSVINLIFALNVTIFILWPLMNLVNQDFMPLHFLVSWNALLQGRWWTLFTSLFSHFNFIHLVINLYVLKEFGGNLEQQIGTQSLIGLYLFSGLASSLSHCLFSRYLLLMPELSALGASGSLSGLLMYLTMLDPKKKVYFLGVFPLSLIYAITGLILIDMRGLWGQYHGEMSFIGHGAHLGGCVGGFIYARFKHKNLSFLNR